MIRKCFGFGTADNGKRKSCEHITSTKVYDCVRIKWSFAINCIICMDNWERNQQVCYLIFYQSISSIYNRCIYLFPLFAFIFISGTSADWTHWSAALGKIKERMKDQKLQERQELQGCLQAQVGRERGRVNVAQRSASRERLPSSLRIPESKESRTQGKNEEQNQKTDTRQNRSKTILKTRQNMMVQNKSESETKNKIWNKRNIE